MMKTILFDLDGTISDPIDGIWHSFNYALEALGFEACDRRTIAKCIGPPLDETFPTITGCNDKDKMDKFVSRYRERFSEKGYSENRLYPGIKEALKTLVENNLQLGLCTYKRKDFAEKILDMFNIRDHFMFISGGTIGSKKSDQIGALLKQDIINKDALMIGDRAVDLVSAHKNALSSAGVLWGYGSKSELSAEKPKYLFKNPAELTQLASI